MNGADPIFVGFLLVARLLVPLGIVVIVTRLLEHWGMVGHTPRPPKNW